MLRTANIYNLQLVRTAAERLGGRTTGLPGLAVLYGPAGWGKTTAAGAVSIAPTMLFNRSTRSARTQ